MEKHTIGKITPKKVPASEAIDGSAGDEESGPRGVWTFFIAFGILLVIFVGFYAYTHYKQQADKTANQYNGFDFTLVQGGLWVVRIEVNGQPYDIPFYYHPRDTTSVLIDKGAILPIAAKPQVIYLTFDPDAGPKPVIAGVEISRLTGSKYNLINIETHGALSRPSNNTKADLPVVSCEQATNQTVVITFIQGRQDLITRYDKNPNCIILQYTDANESIRVADRYAYMLLGIMH